MGYGITLLSAQPPLLNIMLKRNSIHEPDNMSGYATFIEDKVKDIVQRLALKEIKLFRISYEAQEFLGNCHTLFHITNPYESSCFYDNIYVWKRVYQYEISEWNDILKIIEPLVNNYDEEIKIDIIEILKHLFDVIDVANIFMIA